MSKPTTREVTRYSDRIKGQRENWIHGVEFDDTNGFIGISQFQGERLIDRVLLSPAQVTA